MQQTIFVVDNSFAVRMFYKTILESVGYKVQLFSDGASCLGALADDKPDLLLMGAVLPDMDCIDLANQIRTDHENILLPLIVISSSRSMELRKKCFQAGITDFLLKKCTEKFLIERIKLILHRKQSLAFNQHLAGQRFNVLIAEDSVALLKLYGQMFELMGCDPVLCENGEDAWEVLQVRDDIDLVLTDIEMPKMDGVELNHLIRSRADLDQVPVIVVTRFEQQELMQELLTSGASDYICKPFVHEELQARVGAHLRTRHLYKEQKRLNQELQAMNDYLEERVRERTQALYEANVETIQTLAMVCDYKDLDTGNHINRVRVYAEELGRAIGLNSDIVARLGYSSMMHDLGKIATPDRVLNKPGPLNDAEWQVMHEHPEVGARLLGDRSFFTMAKEVALYHHEKVDGSGYPKGLKGDEIPLAARIVAVVDVFDALTSKRSYKEAWSEEEAVKELNKMAGSHLDKRLVDVFSHMITQGHLAYIRKRYPEKPNEITEMLND